MVSCRFLLPGLLAATAWLPASAQSTVQPLASRLSPADIKQAAAATIPQGPIPAPCGCIKDFVDHCRKSTKERWYYLTYTLCITYSNGNVIYSEGALSWNGATQSLQQVQTAGDTAFYNGSRDSSGHPFKFNNQQPKAKVQIRASCVADITRAVTHSVPLLCSGNILYGFLPTQGEGYMISLEKQEMAIPK